MRSYILISGLILFWLIAQSCTSYDMTNKNSDTLAGSLSKMLKPDREDKKQEQKNGQAPVYVDYSKNNPLLRHDQEFDENVKVESDDPFEEKIKFSELQRIKEIQAAREQQKNQEDQISDAEYEPASKKPISFW